jgi:hypothetical protein
MIVTTMQTKLRINRTMSKESRHARGVQPNAQKTMIRTCQRFSGEEDIVTRDVSDTLYILKVLNYSFRGHSEARVRIAWRRVAINVTTFLEVWMSQ